VDRAVVAAEGLEIGAGGGGVLDATFFLQPVQSTDNAVMAKQAIYRFLIEIPPEKSSEVIEYRTPTVGRIPLLLYFRERKTPYTGLTLFLGVISSSILGRNGSTERRDKLREQCGSGPGSC
jgi:hypothetical protein